MKPLQITVLAVSLVWLLGHAGFTFIAGGFDPGSPTANVFVALDTLVIAAIFNCLRKKGAGGVGVF